MMKWNSSKTYTDDDMVRMQQEAVSRVRDFQDRAHNAASFYDVPPSELQEVRDQPLLSDSSSYSQEPCPQNDNSVNPFFPDGNEPEVIEAESHVVSPPEQPTDTLHKILGDLNIDNDVLLIIGMMFLLYNEKADGILLLALGYLLL